MHCKRVLTGLWVACLLWGTTMKGYGYDPVTVTIPCNAGANGTTYTQSQTVGVEQVGDERQVVIGTGGQCQFTRLDASGDGLTIVQTTPSTLPAASVTYRVRITAGNKQGTLTISGDTGPVSGSGTGSGGGGGNSTTTTRSGFQVTVTLKWVRVTFTAPADGALSLAPGQSGDIIAKVEIGSGDRAASGNLGWSANPIGLGSFSSNGGPLAFGIGTTTFTLSNTGTLTADGTITASASTVTDDNQNNLGSGTGTLPVNRVRIALVPDYNRDRKIDDGDKAWSASGHVFRWWINDDHDDGDGGDDTPGSANPNCQTVTVNGVRDLVDFFPVWLDLQSALGSYPPSQGYQYVLQHPQGAVNFVYSDLSRNNVGGLGRQDLTAPSYNSTDRTVRPYAGATKHALIPTEAELSVDFLNQVISDANRAVIFLEACARTSDPLTLEVRKVPGQNGQPYDVVCSATLPLAFDSVINMYRWINLRGVVGAHETRPSNVNVPSLRPDNVTNGKHLILVHGYNVPEAGAWAFGAEKFKQFYQSGCNAMVTTVTWRGNEWNAFNIDLAERFRTSLDYYVNVMNAFNSASACKAVISSLPGQTKCVLAHSLGNMLVSSAVRDHGLSVQQFFMVNAAVARESYDGSIHDEQMTPEEWRIFNPGYFSANWHQLFPANDGRRNLAWNNRFGNVPVAHNYYAAGDEVLDNWTEGDLPPFGRQYVWASQERLKGNGVFLQFPVVTTRGGGWNMNPIYGVPPIPPQDTNLLRTAPFFYPFSKPKLFGNEGDAEARKPEVRALLLGGEIPALSFATGRNQIPSWQLVLRNTEMKSIVDAAGTGWPIRLPGTGWLHSDINDLPYRYLHPVIDNMVTKGGLR